MRSTTSVHHYRLNSMPKSVSYIIMQWLTLVLAVTCIVGEDWTHANSSTVNLGVRKSLYSNIYSKYEGDIYLAAMFSIHHASVYPICGRIIEQDGLQVIAAATFGIEMVRKVMKLPIRIGLLSVDTCQDPDYGLNQSKDFMLFKSCEAGNTYTCLDNKAPRVKEEYKSLQRIFGIFGAGNSDVSLLAATFLRLVELPQISYFSTSPDLGDSVKYPGFFRTIPSDEYTIQAIANLLRRYNWTLILIIHDDSKYSTSTKDSFISFVKRSSKFAKPLCYVESVTLSKDGLAIGVENINKKLIEMPTIKAIVTFLTQAVVEDLLIYIEQNPIKRFNNFTWIGTDSWGGRKWPNVTKNNPVMKNSISVIPRAYPMTDFMAYYKGQLPSVDDYNPWLAEKFEQVCGCQYSNTDLFIYPELAKMRKQRLGAQSCEKIEEQCSKLVHSDVEQMPYIHYVMDGILAYAHVVGRLIGSTCEGLNSSDCAENIWKSGILSNENVTRELKTIKFRDSTNESFYFWKEREGVPSYSVLAYNLSSQKWDNVGSLFGYNVTLRKFRITMDKDFDDYIKANSGAPPCLSDCGLGYKSVLTVGGCCMLCEKCNEMQIVRRPNKIEICEDCSIGYTANENRTECVQFNQTFLNLGELPAVIIFVVDTFGLLFSLFSFIIMITHWNTPIIKAFGRETSLIILLGTVLSFAFSMSLFSKPSLILCALYWFAPAFCNTICYASILVKTNRIVRIFGMNWSSKRKNNTPRFISLVSQISIILFITVIECCVIVILIIVSNVNTIDKATKSKRQLLCTKMNAGNILSAFLIPILLLFCSTFYAFKMRKTPDGFNETRNINFMNFANCVVLVTSLFLYELLYDSDAVYPLCLQMTFSAYGNLIGLFTPKVYLVLFRKDKNTVECVTAMSRTRSQTSVSHPISSISHHSTHGKIRCRKCNSVLQGSLSNGNDVAGQPLPDIYKDKSPPKVFFSEEDFESVDDNNQGNRTDRKQGISNPAFNEKL